MPGVLEAETVHEIRPGRRNRKPAAAWASLIPYEGDGVSVYRTVQGQF
jgi:hypothetical protein